MENLEKELGEQAMELISGYPLYASTSGITYNEAIEIAKITDNDFYKLTKIYVDRIKK